MQQFQVHLLFLCIAHATGSGNSSVIQENITDFQITDLNNCYSIYRGISVTAASNLKTTLSCTTVYGKS